MLAGASLWYVCTDCEAGVLTGGGEPVNAMLHVSLKGSVEGTIIGEQKVVDGVRLNLGLRLQCVAYKCVNDKCQ